MHGWMAGESDRQRVFVCNPLNLPRILPVGAGKSGMSYWAYDVEQMITDRAFPSDKGASKSCVIA